MQQDEGSGAIGGLFVYEWQAVPRTFSEHKPAVGYRCNLTGEARKFLSIF